MSIDKVKGTYLVGGALIALLTILSWFFLVSPRMSESGEIGERTAAAEAANVMSAKEVAALTRLKVGLPNERKVASALAVRFPPTADEPTLFREVVAAAVKAGIPEKSIIAVGPAAPILGGASSGVKLPAAAAPATGAAGAPAQAGVTAASGAQDLATMAISFNAEGNYVQMIKMLQNLEGMRRSFLITQVNLASADGGKFTIAVQGNMYVHRTVQDPG